MKHLIEFQQVSKVYKTGDTVVHAVSDINFTIDPGEFVVILGPSGAGKSTVLNLLGGMDTVTSGHIIIDGLDITSLSDKQLTNYRGSDVGFVFQFYNLVPSLTVIENVKLVEEVSKQALNPKEVIELVGLSNRANLFPSQISGGEQQRVSIARAVCKNPKILLCDEPTGALDSETGNKVLSLLQDMSRTHHRTVIIVTHNANIADAADKVIRFRDGKVLEITRNDAPKAISEVTW
jgi:putative ABC transport system ATP-binding protein